MQTSIDQFVKIRKRPASDNISVLTSRKLFAQDDGPSSPIRSPSRRIPVCHNEKSPRPTTPVRSPATQLKLMEEYGLGEFKRKLPHTKRFELMKSRLAKLNATKAELKKFENLELEVHTSPVKRGNLKPRRLFGHETTKSPRKDQSYVSPRKLLDQGPVTTPTVPAFVRYRQLAEGKDSLVLPPKYSVLAKIFDGVETVLRLLNQRGELATYKRIRADVERMKERKFTEEHLGMIKAVYPESYELNYEKVKTPFSRDESYELVIKLPSGADSVSRTKKFNSLLLERTLDLHEEFLKTLDPPLNIPKEQVMRWHSEFDLNSVPDIVPIPISRPATRTDVAVSAKDILEKTHQLISGNKKMERAITSLVEDRISEEAKTTPELASRPVSTSNKLAAYEKALRGTPKLLLEKLRAKKASKMAEMVTRTPAEVKEEVMLSRLPELVKILRYMYVLKKTNILPEDEVVKSVSYSYPEKLTREDLIEHFKMIGKHLPGWLSFAIVKNKSHIRITKDADMSRVLGRLQNLARSAR